MSLKFRRHFRLLALLPLLVIVLVVGFGNQRIVAYTYEGVEQAVAQGLISGSSLALFDNTAADAVQILDAGAGLQELYAH